MAAPDTLHWSNADVEVHKVVVGPYENNVFVVRCRATGEAVLLDAANEHEQLLELCQRLGVKRVLETHGHWDHIQAVPAMREAGYEVAVTWLDAPKLKDVGYDGWVSVETFDYSPGIDRTAEISIKTLRAAAEKAGIAVG